MAKLSYKTKGSSSPQGKERVYFACHPDDFKAYFEPVCADIFATQNCAIFCNSEPEKPWDEETMKLELGRMQLIVIPVTSRFLYKPNEAREVEFAYAIEKHIPVLPLMQESGLENEFNRICGDLQFLDKNASLRDPTALPYEQKLEKYLKSVLLGDELAEKVRGAFDAYIFLSYRKKDRKYAQELMRLIHKNDFCRDIAIWYDEFLVPGENFNNAIAEAMTKSDLFTFVVTPNLLEPDNYVMKIEYPEARKAGKPILPAEMAETDRDELGKKFEDIPDPTDAHDATALSEALSQGLIEKLRTIAIDENNTDPQHNFFIGLAYLSGIDVETDHERAVQLITSAAEADLPEAMEKLALMYLNGEGVERNYETAAQWLEKLAEYLEERYNETGEDVDGYNLFQTLCLFGDTWFGIKQLVHARTVYEKMLSVADKLKPMHSEFFHLRNLSICYSRLGDLCKEERDLPKARMWYEKDVETNEFLYSTNETIDPEISEFLYGKTETKPLSVSYERMGDICELEGNLSEAEEWYKKNFELVRSFANENGSIEERRNLVKSLSELGELCIFENNLAGARIWFDKAMEVSELLANETGYAEDRRNLAICYYEIGDICYLSDNYFGAKRWYKHSLEIFEKLACEVGTLESLRDMSICNGRMGNIFKKENDMTKAKKSQKRSLAIDLQIFNKTETIESRRDLLSDYYYLGEICEIEGNPSEAKELYEKGVAMIEPFENLMVTVEDRVFLSNMYEKIGDICKVVNSLAEGRKWYEKTATILDLLLEQLDMLEDISRLLDYCRKEALIYKKIAEYYLAECDFSKLYLLNLLGKEIDGDDLENISQAKEWYGKEIAAIKQLVDRTGEAEDYDALAVAYMQLATTDILNFNVDLLREAESILTDLIHKTPGVFGYKQHLKLVRQAIAHAESRQQ